MKVRCPCGYKWHIHGAKLGSRISCPQCRLRCRVPLLLPDAQMAQIRSRAGSKALAVADPPEPEGPSHKGGQPAIAEAPPSETPLEQSPAAKGGASSPDLQFDWGSESSTETTKGPEEFTSLEEENDREVKPPWQNLDLDVEERE